MKGLPRLERGWSLFISPSGLIALNEREVMV